MLVLRPATMDDASRLWRWRNDALTREMSRNTDHVPWDTHVAWLERKLGPDFLIAERDGIPVAVLRIEDGEINYTVAPECRGQGVCSAMLRLAHERYGPLRAEIRRGNLPSIAAAEKAGHEVVLLG